MIFGPKHKEFKGPLQGKETVLKNVISGGICRTKELLNYSIFGSSRLVAQSL
jgi:hypothetical protein